MAWPNTPLTTYLSGGLPFIKAFDLNAFQSAINGIINATYSLKAVVIDGTGGAIVVPVAGTAKLSATASGVGSGMTAVPWGTFYKEAGAFAACNVDDTGAAVTGFNVKTIPGLVGGAGHPVTGEYVITFNGAPTNSGRCVAVVSPGWTAAAARAYFARVSNIGVAGSDLEVSVLVTDIDGTTAIDAPFGLVVFGG